jgi:hypothetical protein
MQVAPLRALIALVLAGLTLMTGGCSRLQGPSTASPSAALVATPPSGALQEVAPPGAVVQLQERLAGRAPQVRITAPADDTLLPEGPWNLQLTVNDWPMAAQPAGAIGPHVVVQLDQLPPQRLEAEAVRQPIPMPALTPGSHRLTVYAARPWGEAVKSPGAIQQIRLHRVGRNDAELPGRGTPQMIVASPDGSSSQEPVLVDWLLLDAPLQNLRDDDARWRLRVSVNGDSFLVDRQTPLWLKGLRRGSNAVLLELLDGRGEPLNPPFNSIVREVVIGTAGRPPWLSSSLSAEALAELSGQGHPAAPSAGPSTAAPVEVEAEADNEPEIAAEAEIEAEAEADLKAAVAVETQQQDPEPAPAGTEPLAAQTAGADTTPATDPPAAEPTAAADASAGREGRVELTPEPPITPPAQAATAPERLRAGSSLKGSAREQVNADGSLQQPPRRSPLAGLREKLGG